MMSGAGAWPYIVRAGAHFGIVVMLSSLRMEKSYTIVDEFRSYLPVWPHKLTRCAISG